MIDRDYKKVGFFVMESRAIVPSWCIKKFLHVKTRLSFFIHFFLLDLDQIKKKQNEMLQQGKMFVCLYP